MEEELVTFEIAKLAKEKGFNLKTEKFYIKNGEIHNYESYDYYKNKRIDFKDYFDDWNKNNRGDEPDKRFSAPTQCLLQKWLREKHNTHIDIWYNVLTEKYRIEFISGSEPLEDRELKTYEEALEEGLYKALKLIK